MKSPNNEVQKETWMTCPTIQCDHPGLAYICALDQLIIAAKKDPLHDIIGLKGKTFVAYNKERQKTFVALQKTRFKRYSLKVFNYYGNEVISVKRGLFRKYLIWAPAGHLVGSMAKPCPFKNTFIIRNSNEKVIITIAAKSKCPLVFKIMSKDEEIGEIKHGAGDMFGDSFGVTFPISLDIQIKAVLIGACFLIAFLKY